MNWGCSRGSELPSRNLLHWIPVDSCHLVPMVDWLCVSDAKTRTALNATGALPRSRYHTVAGGAPYSQLQLCRPRMTWRASTGADYDLVALIWRETQTAEEQSASTGEKD